MATVILWVDVPATEVLTSNQRLHWGERARRTRALRWRATLAYRQAGKPRLEVAHCVARLTYRDRRRRDAHNIMPTLKALIDGVVAAGLLPDDDDTHLTGPDLRIAEPDREQPGYLCVELRFVGHCPVDLEKKRTPAVCITADAVRGGGGTIDRNHTLRASQDVLVFGGAS